MRPLSLKSDIVSPWTVGRYTPPAPATRYAQGTTKQVIESRNERGEHYLPVVFPWFSWHNVKPQSPLTGFPAVEGNSWTQFVEAKEAGAMIPTVAFPDEPPPTLRLGRYLACVETKRASCRPDCSSALTQE